METIAQRSRTSPGHTQRRAAIIDEGQDKQEGQNQDDAQNHPEQGSITLQYKMYIFNIIIEWLIRGKHDLKGFDCFLM